MHVDIHDFIQVSPSPRRLASFYSTYSGESWTSETSGDLKEPNRLSDLGYPPQSPCSSSLSWGDGDSEHMSLSSS